MSQCPTENGLYDSYEHFIECYERATGKPFPANLRLGKAEIPGDQSD